ncbi:MAG: hypothetical protein WCT40_05155 [Candidatus Magasanikbacteria bacterium]|jgi:hypothetical protein
MKSRIDPERLERAKQIAALQFELGEAEERLQQFRDRRKAPVECPTCGHREWKLVGDVPQNELDLESLIAERSAQITRLIAEPTPLDQPQESWDRCPNCGKKIKLAQESQYDSMWELSCSCGWREKATFYHKFCGICGAWGVTSTGSDPWWDTDCPNCKNGYVTMG